MDQVDVKQNNNKSKQTNLQDKDVLYPKRLFPLFHNNRPKGDSGQDITFLSDQFWFGKRARSGWSLSGQFMAMRIDIVFEFIFTPMLFCIW